LAKKYCTIEPSSVLTDQAGACPKVNSGISPAHPLGAIKLHCITAASSVNRGLVPAYGQRWLGARYDENGYYIDPNSSGRW